MEKQIVCRIHLLQPAQRADLENFAQICDELSDTAILFTEKGKEVIAIRTKYLMKQTGLSVERLNEVYFCFRLMTEMKGRGDAVEFAAMSLFPYHARDFFLQETT